MTTTLDPCSACKKFKKGRVNVMDCCYSTCRDWLGIGQNIEGSQCYKMCRGCLDEFIEKDGKTECTYYTAIPLNFEQVPSFFPELYKQTNDKNKALALCKKKCLDTKFPNTCLDKCNINFESLIVEPTPNLESSSSEVQKSIQIEKPNESIYFHLIIIIIILVILTSFLVGK